MPNPTSDEHIPVLVNETIEGLRVRARARYIDATLGDGGHAAEIVRRGARLLAIDRDPQAVLRASQRLRKLIREYQQPGKNRQKDDDAAAQSTTNTGIVAPVITTGNFKDIRKIARRYGFTRVAGILFDLGVASFQFEDPSRGLSFERDGPLDMRLDPSLTRSAADIVNRVSEGELYAIFTRHAQEELARPIARAIVSARRLKPIQTTGELGRIVASVMGYGGKLHPATKVFLALRIEVNKEMENLHLALPQAIKLLAPQGRLAVLSFHETEDRVVKQFLLQGKKQGQLDLVAPKPLTPTEAERRANPRARSARLRIAVIR